MFFARIPEKIKRFFSGDFDKHREPNETYDSYDRWDYIEEREERREICRELNRHGDPLHRYYDDDNDRF
ncbi:MAG: hypothetical protein ACI4JY_04040 [Oscillospiraceae bacterium]